MKITDIQFTILAAGKSSRNYPHSKGLPHKSLLPFGSKKIIDYILSEIILAGGKDITLIVSDQSAITAFQENFVREKGVEEKFKSSGNQVGLKLLKNIYLPDDVKINYIIQDKPRGLGHAIAMAAEISPDKHLGIILPDDLIIAGDGGSIIKKVVDQYVADDRGGNLFLTREVEDVSRWGIIEDGYFKEKPETSVSKASSIMFFILDKKVAAFIYDEMVKLETVKSGQEIHYSDYLNHLIKEDPDHMKIRTMPLEANDLYLDCGSIEGYEKSLLFSLLNLSTFRKENLAYIRSLI